MIVRLMVVAAAWATVVVAHGHDWPEWRGPEQNGVARESAPVTSWSPAGENLRWKVDFGGRTTPIVLNGRVYFVGPVGEGECSQEHVVCVDAQTGKLLWEQKFNVFHTDIVENRVGWTAIAGDPETGNVYCHATGGELICFDPDGKTLWKRSLTEEFGRISGYGGRLINPVIDEDRVVVSYLSSGWGAHGKGEHRFFAFDKRTGEVVYIVSPGGQPLDTTYANPVVAVIGGKRMLIAPAADGAVYGLLARTGETVWSYRLSKRGLNVSPVVAGDRVYVGHSEENLSGNQMGAVVCIDGSLTGDISESGAVWKREGLEVGYCSPALLDGRLYVVTNSATMLALNADTGETFWEQNLGRVGKGSPVITSDKTIYVGEQTGIFLILRDQGDGCEVLHQHEFKRDDGLVDEFFGSPAIANGAVFFMTRYGTYCLADDDAGIQEQPLPPLVNQQTREADAAVTEAGGGKLQLVPAEVTLAPGESVRFALREFTPSTMGPVKTGTQDNHLKWSAVDLPGELTADGVFTAATANSYAAGTLTVQRDEQQATARVRIVPNLPIRVTFDDISQGSSPPGWISAGPRVKVVDLDGEQVLEKVAPKERPSPPFMRLETYITPALPAGYVVQGDLRSEQKVKGRRSYLPDMGLINARYSFRMLGADIKAGSPTLLRIESWGPVPRVRQDLEFAWQPDTWYTAKFEVTPTKDGQALCRAKVWPRGEAEPEEWTIELSDPCPNLAGSAGIYAYSTGTTPGSDGPRTFFDNVMVTRND